jgi:hypothetical protein
MDNIGLYIGIPWITISLIIFIRMVMKEWPNVQNGNQSPSILIMCLALACKFSTAICVMLALIALFIAGIVMGLGRLF